MIGGLERRVAVVTGGASGIGAACCALLAESGAVVMAADLDGDPRVDVTDRETLDALAQDGRVASTAGSTCSSTQRAS